MDNNTKIPGAGENMPVEFTPVNAQGTVYVSANRMMATIALTEPQYGGAALSLKDLMDLLEANRVRYGLDMQRIERLAEKPEYGTRVPIAFGVAPVKGENATLEFFVRKEKELRPKELPDGSVDYKDLSLVDEVEAGHVLCVKTPATDGVAGSDVFGQVIRAAPGKDAIIPAGKNTELSEDGLRLCAAISGQSVYINGKIHVLDILTIDGDVSTATGDIKFSGNVLVRGGVSSGFKITASGNIDIAGFVEAATIAAEGNLIIRGGFNGGGSGSLNVGGDATLRFIQSGFVNVHGNLDTTYIMNADVRCGGSINLSGRGLIIGGNIMARTSISANVLGSPTSTGLTQIEVGNDPEMLKRFYEIPKLLEECAKTIAKFNVLTTTLLQLRDAGRLTEEKKEVLKKSIEALSQLKQSQINMEEEREMLKEKISEMGSGWVRVQKSAYPGVRIVIGNEQMLLRDEYSYTIFSRSTDGITFAPIR